MKIFAKAMTTNRRYDVEAVLFGHLFDGMPNLIQMSASLARLNALDQTSPGSFNQIQTAGVDHI